MEFQALNGQFNSMQSINEIEELIRLISKLPGLGPKSAKRIVLKLLNTRDELMKPMVNSLAEVYKNVSRCKVCGTLKSNSVGCKKMIKNLIRFVLLKILLTNGALRTQVFIKVIFIF